jgi:carbon monoxide dehydrogenase subunit G
MHLEDEFTIATPPDRAFELLLDLRRVAPCVPGAELGEPDAEGVYPGRVSVKVGPMKFTYDGRVRISAQDPVTRTAVITGEARATGGADTAKVATTMEVLPDGTGSRVRMTTELEIKGRAAQMGQGVIADVGRRLVRDAAACIETRLGAPDGDDSAMPASQPVGGLSLMASVVGARVGDSVRRLGGRGRTDEHDQHDQHDEKAGNDGTR